MKKLAWYISAVAFTIVAGCGQENISLSERYSGPWQEDFHTGITRVLAQNNIRNCGQYKYRESSKDRNEFLVYCTADGGNWIAYIVWPNTGGIVGPNYPDPNL